MSVLEEVLAEEYARSKRLLDLMGAELAELPKGSIRTRNIKGHDYYYLNHRVGNQVKSDYIPAIELSEIQSKIERRKMLEQAVKEHKQTLKQIERALGGAPHAD